MKRLKARYNLYKPLKKDGAGAAFQFSYDHNKRAVFIDAAPQNGPKLAIGSKDQFNWKEDKITFKVGETDIGKLMLAFSNIEKKAECIHSPENSDYVSRFEVEKQDNEYKNFRIRISKTIKTDDGKRETKQVAMYVNMDEAFILGTFFKEALTRMLGFDTSFPVDQIGGE